MLKSSHKLSDTTKGWRRYVDWQRVAELVAFAAVLGMLLLLILVIWKRVC